MPPLCFWRVLEYQRRIDTPATCILDAGFPDEVKQALVELAKQFNVSTDYLLGMENTSTISIVGLSQKQVAVLLETIDCFKNPHE